MAENIPNVPAGAVPPKKETGKVQPKKETVRINLPPKPSAAPTIKMPTLPPGGPTGASTSLPLAAGTAAPAHAPTPPAPRVGTAAPVAQQRPPPPSSQQRGVATRTAAAPTISKLDTALAIAAAVTALVAVGATVWIMYLFPTN